MIRALIVDDEPLARDVLRIRLGEEDGIDVVGEADNSTDLEERVARLHPDVVFLDIVMPGRSGLEVARRLVSTGSPAIVFVTAHAEHALRAFELSAVDYLCKPFTTARLRLTLARIRERMALNAVASEHRQLRAFIRTMDADDEVTDPHDGGEIGGEAAAWLPIRDGDRYVMIDPRDIYWVEAAANYVLIHLASGVHRARTTLGAFVQRLDTATFARVHRAAIVNRRQIREIRPTWHGDYVIHLTNGATVRLSRGYRAALLGRRSGQ